MARRNSEHDSETDDNAIDLERGLKTDEAGKIIGAAPITMAQWRLRGEGPPFYRPSRRAVRYRLGDLLAWRDARTVGRRP